MTKGTGKYLPSVVASNTIVVLGDTSIQGRLFSLVVIRGQIVLLLFQCVNSLQIGHLAPLHRTRTSSHSVSSYTYERYLNSIVTRQRQASGFVAARLGSDMVVGTYVGKEVGV